MRSCRVAVDDRRVLTVQRDRELAHVWAFAAVQVDVLALEDEVRGSGRGLRSDVLAVARDAVRDARPRTFVHDLGIVFVVGSVHVEQERLGVFDVAGVVERSPQQLVLTIGCGGDDDARARVPGRTLVQRPLRMLDAGPRFEDRQVDDGFAVVHRYGVAEGDRSEPVDEDRLGHHGFGIAGLVHREVLERGGALRRDRVWDLWQASSARNRPGCSTWRRRRTCPDRLRRA